MLCADLTGEETHRRGDICARAADPLFYTAETNTALQVNCAPIETNENNKSAKFSNPGQHIQTSQRKHCM